MTIYKFIAPESTHVEQLIFEDMLRQLYESYGIDRPHTEDVQYMLRSLYGRVAFPEVADTVRILRQSYRVVIGSTTDTAPLWDNLRENGLGFDAVYTSESLRAYKPDPAFYRTILTTEKRRAEDAVFIGDSLLDDIQGPRACGMATVLIDRKGKYAGVSLPESQRPDHILSDLTQLLNVYPRL